MFGRKEKTEPSERPAPAEAAPEPKSFDGMRVLLVDDNEINRKITCALMSQSGMSFALAETGAEALERLAEEEFDLVLLDMHMPGMSGEETIKRLRASGQSWSELPVIALTSKNYHRDDLRRMGMDGYAEKPVARDKLLEEIERALLFTRVRGSRVVKPSA